MPPILDWLDVFEARLRARRPSVLLISDDPVLARDDSAALLRAGLEATAAIGPAAAIQALDYHVPDLLIIDTGQTTVRDGLELARMLRQSHTCHDLPAVFWGAAEGFRPATPVISHRDCFLPRPPDAAALVRDVLPCAQRARDARDIAAQDPLTRLLHRMSFETRGAAELAQTRRTGGICSLALLKIDGFEETGTQFGEAACDHVLKAMARLLRCRLRSSDLTASLGNGAFAVLLSGAAPGCARSALDALQSGFAQIVFEQGAEAFQTGFRFGLCGSHDLSWPKIWDYAGRALVSELNFRPDS